MLTNFELLVVYLSSICYNAFCRRANNPSIYDGILFLWSYIRVFNICHNWSF
nr:MAG TPA: hypothetical protein [Caudoviricetes sp.]